MYNPLIIPYSSELFCFLDLVGCKGIDVPPEGEEQLSEEEIHDFQRLDKADLCEPCHA